MIALTDGQLATVMTAATPLPVDKRGIFLERVAAQLHLRGRYDDTAVEEAVRAALRGLLQAPAA